ncbi:MAG: hypothetical protein M0R46_14235 [Candidatus Muirbacterium halophilum]|nr:hypothetical protein [Candidatus Muirbacterium halophilum]MCK9477080.1 hypothetical protein [Candidatus Muirbacterium halophilum]
MKRITMLFFVLLFCISSFSQQDDIFTSLEKGVSEIKNTIDYLNKDSQTVKNISEILAEYYNDNSSDRFDLITELNNELSNLTLKDGEVRDLENLASVNEFFRGIINAEYSYDVDNVAVESRVRTYETRGSRNVFDKVFGKISFDKAKEKIKEEIANLDVDFDIKLLDLDIAEGIGMAAKYKWELEPSYQDGYYTRIDAYNLKAHLNPGDIIKDLAGVTLPIYLNITNEHKVIFARQFKDQLQAAKALPYNFIRIPVNADNAKKMDAGDFVSIPATLNTVIGVSAGYTSGISVSGNVYYTIAGEFRINILRLPEDKVRVKLVGLRKKGHGAGVSAGYGVNLFGIKVLDKQIGKFLDTNIFRVDYSDIDGQNFSVDYVFDLKDENAKNAYDSLLSSNLKFNVAKTANPFNKDKIAAEEFFNDADKAERLFQQDLGLSENKRRVNRLFKATNFFEQKNFNAKIGFNLIKFSWGKNYIENRLAVYNDNNTIKTFFIPVMNVNSDSKFLFGYYKEGENKNFYSLLPTDNEWNVRDLETFSYTWRKTDKICYVYEFKRLKEELLLTLGKHADKELKNLKIPDEKIRKLRWDFKIVFDRDSALALFGTRSTKADEYWIAMLKTMEAWGDKACGYAQNHDNNDDDYWRTNTSKFSNAKKAVFKLFEKNRYDYSSWRNVERYVREMQGIFETYSYNDKMKKYYELVKNSFYRKFSIRFLIELAEVKGTDLNFKLNFTTSAQGYDKFTKTYGNHKINETLYHSLNRMISQITDQTYDLYEATQMDY